MRKPWFIILIVAAALLAACAQAAPGAPAENTAAPEEKTAAPTEKPASTQDPNAVKMECQVVSLEPTQGPTEVSMFPPTGKDDWVMGKNPDAALTITEYSDFQ
jgi:hypothetical protein